MDFTTAVQIQIQLAERKVSLLVGVGVGEI